MQTYINTQYCNAGSKKKRYGVRLTVVQNSQSVSNNTSNITVTFELGGAGALGLSTDYTGSSFNGYACYGTIYVNGSEKASGSSSATIKNNTKVTLASWTGNVSHNADGSLSIPIKGVFTGGTSTQASGGEASGTVTFDTIPRASSVSCTTANVGAKPTFTISRASSGFTHTLKYSFGSLSGTIATGVGTSYNSWTIPTTFYAQMPNSTSATGTITCDTYNGSTYIGSKTCAFTVTVPSTAKPNISNPTIVDTDTVSKNTIQLYVVSKSKLKFTFPTFSTSYGSTLKNYTLKINGTQVYSGTDSSYTMGSPISATSNKYELIITDSRNISNTTGEISFTAYAYTAPTCSITAERNSTTPTTINITYSGAITNINSNGKNAKSFKIEYKQSTSSSWTTITTVTDAYTKTNIALSRTSVDDSHSFDFRITAADSYGNATATIQIGTSATLINFSADGTAIAFGKASEEASTFECNLKSKFTKQVDMTGSLNVSGTINQIGSLSSLTTTAKTDTVSAINELKGNIGTLSSLNTESKTNLVSAINSANNFGRDPQWMGMYSSRKTLNFSSWSRYDLTGMIYAAGNSSDGEYLKATSNGVYIKKNCTVITYVQSTIDATGGGDVTLKLVNSRVGQINEHYQSGYGWTFGNTFAIIRCNAGDTMKMGWTVGNAGNHEILDDTYIWVAVIGRG